MSAHSDDLVEHVAVPEERAAVPEADAPPSEPPAGRPDEARAAAEGPGGGSRLGGLASAAWGLGAMGVGATAAAASKTMQVGLEGTRRAAEAGLGATASVASTLGSTTHKAVQGGVTLASTAGDASKSAFDNTLHAVSTIGHIPDQVLGSAVRAGVQCRPPPPCAGTHLRGQQAEEEFQDICQNGYCWLEKRLGGQRLALPNGFWAVWGGMWVGGSARARPGPRWVRWQWLGPERGHVRVGVSASATPTSGGKSSLSSAGHMLHRCDPSNTSGTLQVGVMGFGCNPNVHAAHAPCSPWGLSYVQRHWGGGFRNSKIWHNTRSVSIMPSYFRPKNDSKQPGASKK